MGATTEDHAGVPLSEGAWRRVLVVMEKLALSSDLDEILSIVIDAMRDCLDADRASVFLYFRVCEELSAARPQGVAPRLRIPASRGLAGEAVRTRRIISVPDCQADPRFNPEVDQRTGYVTRSMLTVPLVSFNGEVEGVAQVLNKRGDGAEGVFGAVDEQVARGLASQAAVAIRRARLIEAERRKTKIEADLAIAREIQLAALPAALPETPGYDIAAQTIPADETGGDIYDVVRLPAGAGGGKRQMMLVADAAGHGVGPALAVTTLQAMLRLAANLGTPLRVALEAINRQLCESLPIGRYVAVVVGVLNPDDGSVELLTAGLSTVLTVRSDGTVEGRDVDALALGIEPEWSGQGAEPVRLAPGEAMVIITDGYTEAMNQPRSMFGIDRVEASLRRALPLVRAAEGGSPARALLAALDADLAAFVGDRPANDDRTALVIYRRP